MNQLSIAAENTQKQLYLKHADALRSLLVTKYKENVKYVERETILKESFFKLM